tara:strand:- start:9204 stop:9338 length:135 start_codon:yes stop_codon:yes gene_type:complete
MLKTPTPNPTMPPAKEPAPGIIVPMAAPAAVYATNEMPVLTSID